MLLHIWIVPKAEPGLEEGHVAQTSFIQYWVFREGNGPHVDGVEVAVNVYKGIKDIFSKIFFAPCKGAVWLSLPKPASTI